MRLIYEVLGFFYQCGEYGWQKYGRYLSCIDILACDLWGDEYIGQRIAAEHERYERECVCWGYVGECLNALTRGAMNTRLFDILTGDRTPEISADEARESVLSEFKRLGGEKK